MNSGVYEIKNLGTMRVYIGSSGAVRERWLTHKSQLNNGLHGNPDLQRDWLALGADQFEFSIVEPVADAANLITREQYWIDHLKASAEGYNRKPIAAKSGAKTSSEMRDALRLVMDGATGREAARQAGVREESLYRRPEYKAWRKTQKGNGK